MALIKRSPLALAILAMLYEAPMHPYRMQALIRERGKDEVINVTQRASLYQTIQRLERSALVSARAAVSKDNRPERTVYELTPAGRDAVMQWMREMLSTPTAEFPDFPAALSFLMLLKPADAQRQLERRAAALHTEIERIHRQMAHIPHLPRLFLLEIELLLAGQQTELRWVETVIEDLRSGRLTWSQAWLRKVGAELQAEHRKLKTPSARQAAERKPTTRRKPKAKE